jgi:hypothetical protein
MTEANQLGDVLLYNGPDGGTINVEGGITEMTGGMETAIYLSIFGGNIDDNGTTATQSKQYWQNWNAPEDEKLRSETQNILSSLPATSSNLRVVEDAVLKDLKWLEASASSITVSARIPSIKRVEITINIEAVGERESFVYSANWEAMKQ